MLGKMSSTPRRDKFEPSLGSKKKSDKNKKKL
jgi:hypothetical protein